MMNSNVKLTANQMEWIHQNHKDKEVFWAEGYPDGYYQAWRFVWSDDTAPYAENWGATQFVSEYEAYFKKSFEEIFPDFPF